MKFYGFYGKNSVGIYLDPCEMLKLKRSIVGFHFQECDTIEQAKQYIKDGYNSMRFLSNRIETIEKIRLNKVYTCKEMRSMGWHIRE